MERISRGTRGQRLAAAIFAALMALPGAALAAREWNLQTPVTEIARQQFELHTFIFWTCVVIFVGVFGEIGRAHV